MKILVTGGLGFIGINYLRMMAKKYPNDQFVCLDKMTYAANLPSLLENFSNIRLVIGDICNEKLVDKLFKNELFDIVINFAAETHVDNSFKAPILFVETNVKGTSVLLEASRIYHVKKFHQVSTDEVYGGLPLETNYAFKEDDPLKPTSPYSASKASADLLCLAYHQSYNLNVSITRASNNYGLFQNREKFIPKCVDSFLHNQKMTIYGDGKNVRDYLDVRDHVNAIDLISRDEDSDLIYNICANAFYDNNTIAREIASVFNKDINDLIYVNDRPSHDKKYRMSNSKFVKRYHYQFRKLDLCKLAIFLREFEIERDHIYGKK